MAHDLYIYFAMKHTDITPGFSAAVHADFAACRELAMIAFDLETREADIAKYKALCDTLFSLGLSLASFGL